jgi:hypothetical protein
MEVWLVTRMPEFHSPNQFAGGRLQVDCLFPIYYSVTGRAQSTLSILVPLYLWHNMPIKRNHRL